MISAEIIADSITSRGERLTTFKLVFPRIVLAEFNTHRMISRNSASSRAIPFEKMLERAKNDPFIPIKWMKDHTGMQGNEYLEEPEASLAKGYWLMARDEAVRSALFLSENNVTKQVINRLLEPFMYHTVIATATEWENFFALRADSMAEIHIQDLAYKMLEVYNDKLPVYLKDGEWHIPFGDKIDHRRLMDSILEHGMAPTSNNLDEAKIKIATARCARISYNNFEGKDDYVADFKLHDRLATSGHWSPFEHCARVMSDYEHYNWSVNVPAPDQIGIGPRHLGWCGNFRGFVQYRKLFKGENRTDKRVIKPNLEEI